jgi:hypothetical protein
MSIKIQFKREVKQKTNTHLQVVELEVARGIKITLAKKKI